MKRFLQTAPVLGLLTFLAGIIFVTRDATSPLAWGTCGLGVLLFLTIFYRGVSQNLGNYVNSTLYALFVLGTAVALFKIVQNRRAEWDLTKNKMHSLSPQTVDFLAVLQAPVHLLTFAGDVEKLATVEELRRFTAHTRQLTFEVANPYRDVQRILELKRSDANLQIGANDTFVIRYEDAVDPESGETVRRIARQKKISGTSEEQLLNAIIDLTADRSYRLYALQGHGEPHPAQKPEDDKSRTISTLRRVVGERGIELLPLNLSRRGVVPEDCDALVCIAPLADLGAGEAKLLGDYLEGGGKAMFFLSPPQAQDVTFDHFRELFARFGIKALTDQVVLDFNPLSQLTKTYTQFPVLNYVSHPVTKSLAETTGFQVNWAMPLEPMPDGKKFNYQDLLFSSKKSWSESARQLYLTKRMQPSQDEEIKPRSIAAVVSRGVTRAGSLRSTKLFLLGTGSCLLDGNLQNPQAHLFYNAANWMIERRSAVAIPAAKLENTPAKITPRQKNLLITCTVFIFPSLLFFGGLGYTILRRRQP